MMLGLVTISSTFLEVLADFGATLKHNKVRGTHASQLHRT